MEWIEGHETSEKGFGLKPGSSMDSEIWFWDGRFAGWGWWHIGTKRGVAAEENIGDDGCAEREQWISVSFVCACGSNHTCGPDVHGFSVAGVFLGLQGRRSRKSWQERWVAHWENGELIFFSVKRSVKRVSGNGWETHRPKLTMMMSLLGSLEQWGMSSGLSSRWREGGWERKANVLEVSGRFRGGEGSWRRRAR